MSLILLILFSVVMAFAAVITSAGFAGLIFPVEKPLPRWFYLCTIAFLAVVFPFVFHEWFLI